MPACFVIDPPNDVRLLVSGSTTSVAEERFARGCAAAARRVSRDRFDPSWVLTVAQLFQQTAWLGAKSARDPVTRARHAAAYVLRVRSLAARVLLVLDPADAAARDALATRWAAPRRTQPVVGAGALFPVDESGAAADALIAVIVAAAIDEALSARVGTGWAGRDDVAASEQLSRLGGLWDEGGAPAVLRALGREQLDGSPVIARARSLGS
jgi:hypothetical protein